MLKVYTDAATNLEKSGGGVLIISEKQQQLAFSLINRFCFIPIVKLQ